PDCSSALVTARMPSPVNTCPAPASSFLTSALNERSAIDQSPAASANVCAGYGESMTLTVPVPISAARFISRGVFNIPSPAYDPRCRICTAKLANASNRTSSTAPGQSMARDLRPLGAPGSESFQVGRYPSYQLTRLVSRYNTVIEAELRRIRL